jgi:serine protease inhibitor
MMYQHAVLHYAENKEVQFLELPYIGRAFSMYVVLPRETVPVKKLAPFISADIIEALRSSATSYEPNLFA